MFDPLQSQAKKLTARQIRISENLHYIGEGPRAFFLDAIALVNESSLESKQHLVAHLMREIDSAIRGVVKPLLNPSSHNKKNGKCDKHEASIRDTLTFLGIDPLSEVGKSWLEYGNTDSEAQLHKFAHRKDLTYRSFSEDFYNEWIKFERILDDILDRFKSKYLHFVREVEKFSSLEKVSSVDESKFRNSVAPASPLFRIFVQDLSSSVWFEPLWRMNYFQFSEHEKKYINTNHYIEWLPLFYLRKLVELNEFDKVWFVIDSLSEFENFGLHQEITRLCLKMPETFFLIWMEKELHWFQRTKKLDFINIDLYSEAIERVWNLGNEKLCFGLLSSILEVSPDPNWDYQEGRFRNADEFKRWHSPEPCFKLSEYSFLDLLSYFCSILQKKLPLELVRFLLILKENILKFGLRVWEETDEPYIDDQSYITRSTIWDHPQNYNHLLIDKLVPLFRDAILNFIEAHNGFDIIIEDLKSKKWVLFQRFYIFVIGMYGRKKNSDLFKEVLYDEIFANDECFGNEYFNLLSQNFPNFTKEEQEKYLAWLDKAALKLREKYKSEFEREVIKEPIDLTDMFRPENRLDFFYYRKLPAMQGFLPPDKEKYLEELKVLFHKSLVKPEFPHYHESFVGPVSPLVNQDISSLPIPDLIQKMIEFKKEEDGWNEPSPEGLARQISRDVEINPTRYIESIDDFCNEQIPYRYLESLLWGFRAALDNAKKLDSAVLCQYLHFLFDSIKTKQVEQTFHIQHTLASFLRTIFERNVIDKIHFEQFEFLAWINLLLKSTSPDEEYESKGEDFVSKGINSVRGNALHSLVYLLIDYYQKFLKPNVTKGSEDPLVQSAYFILTEHLTGEYASRKIDRSVLGQHFAFLYWMNPVWFQENDKLLLNENKELSRIFFHTYVQYGGYSDGLYSKFYQWFSESIDFLRELGDQVREDRGIRPLRIGELLLNLYGNSVIKSYDDSIIDNFFSLPQGFLKGNAIRYIGVNVPKEETEIIKRAEALWRWRLENRPSPEEFDAFSEWIERRVYSEDIVFETLSKVIPKSLGSYGVVKYLHFVRENFAKNPIVAIKFIDIITKENTYYLNSKPGEDLWEILMLGISEASSEEVRDISEDIIHRLGSFGYFHYRELVEL
ncbi:hypothetical protein AB3N60_12815 [Leptospira sp. WS39.C2]